MDLDLVLAETTWVLESVYGLEHDDYRAPLIRIRRHLPLGTFEKRLGKLDGAERL